MTALPAEQVARLIKIVRRRHDADRSDWSPTPRRKELENLAEQLVALATLLRTPGVTQTELELMHDAPRTRVGDDGVTAEDALPRPYKLICHDLRALANTALEAAEALPDSRKRTAPPSAALGFLHLRYENERSRPSLYVDGEDIAEFEALCQAAGLFYSRERLKDSLRTALATFDPLYLPPELHGLV